MFDYFETVLCTCLLLYECAINTHVFCARQSRNSTIERKWPTSRAPLMLNGPGPDNALRIGTASDTATEDEKVTVKGVDVKDAVVSLRSVPTKWTKQTTEAHSKHGQCEMRGRDVYE